MDIQITLTNIDSVIDRLKDVPNGARWALHHSIKDALTTGRTAITRLVRERYNVPYGWVKHDLGEVHMTGLTGWLEAVGSKVPLFLFPNRQIKPFGVVASEVKNEAPINLLHAFVATSPFAGRKVIFQRQDENTKRFPIKWVMGLSVPEMIGESKHIQPAVEHIMMYGNPGQKDGYFNRIEHYIDQFLNEKLIPGRRLRVP